MKSSLELDVLRALLEAGEENLPTVFNTMLVLHKTEPHIELLEHTAAAVDSLVNKGFVELVWYRDGWVPVDQDDRRKFILSNCTVVWDEGRSRWRWNKALAAESPLLTLTGIGKKHVTEALRHSR